MVLPSVLDGLAFLCDSGDTERVRLTLALHLFELLAPVVASPREIVRKFFH